MVGTLVAAIWRLATWHVLPVTGVAIAEFAATFFATPGKEIMSTERTPEAANEPAEALKLA